MGPGWPFLAWWREGNAYGFKKLGLRFNHALGQSFFRKKILFLENLAFPYPFFLRNLRTFAVLSAIFPSKKISLKKAIIRIKRTYIYIHLILNHVCRVQADVCRLVTFTRTKDSFITVVPTSTYLLTTYYLSY